MIAAREWSWGEEDFEVEPGESDALHADFIIPSDVKTVQLYAFVKNPRKNKEGLGWTTAELTSFDRGKGEGVHDRPETASIAVLSPHRAVIGFHAPMERNAMFAEEPPPVSNRTHFSALRDRPDDSS